MLVLEHSTRAVGHEVGIVLASVAGPAAAAVRPVATPSGIGRGAVLSRPPSLPLAVGAAAPCFVHAEEGIGSRTTVQPRCSAAC